MSASAMPARLLPGAEPESLRIAAECLRAGQVVGMPTETVYGLAGDAFNEAALARIFKAKDRPTFDPLIVHVAPPTGDVFFTGGTPWTDHLARLELIDLPRIPAAVRESLEKLLAAFWPGPLTVVLPKHARVPDLATSGLANVGLRAPRHPVAQALIRAAGQPLAAPSANRFGRISPTSASAVMAELGDRIPLVLDGGACEVGLESTVVHFDISGIVTLLRPGGVALSEIEAVLGKPLKLASPAAAPAATGGAAQLAPGMLASHYAPRKPMRVLAGAVTELSPEMLSPLMQSARVGLLTFTQTMADAMRSWRELTGQSPAEVRTLAAEHSHGARIDLDHAARRLFSEMRALDESESVEIILSEPCPSDEGLGHAIADRLRRASAT